MKWEGNEAWDRVFSKPVIFILYPNNLENAMVKGHLDQRIKANEHSLSWVMV